MEKPTGKVTVAATRFRDRATLETSGNNVISTVPTGKVVVTAIRGCLHSAAMIDRWFALLVAFGLLSAPCLATAEKARELIRDPSFRQGVFLHKATPGKHVRYGELLPDEKKTPLWALLQWSSRFELDPKTDLRSRYGTLTCSNVAKSLVLSRGNKYGDIILSANSGAEYIGDGRKAGEP